MLVGAPETAKVDKINGKERTPRFATRILVNGPPWPADLRLRDVIECTGVPGALGDRAKVDARRGGCRPAVCSDDIVCFQGYVYPKLQGVGIGR